MRANNLETAVQDREHTAIMAKGDIRKAFSENLEAFKRAIANMITNSRPEDQNYIKLFLSLFKCYIDSWYTEVPNAVTKRLLSEKLIPKFEAVIEQLQYSGNNRILHSIENLMKIVTLGHCYYVPNKILRKRVVDLVISLERSLKSDSNLNCSGLTECLTIEKSTVPKTNNKYSSVKPEFDITMLTLVKEIKEALDKLIDELIKPPITIRRVLIKFAIAIKYYVAYGKTMSTDFYDKSVLCFSTLSCGKHLRSENFVVLLIRLKKITNLIICTIPEYQIPSRHLIVETVDLFVCLLKFLKVTGEDNKNLAGPLLLDSYVLESKHESIPPKPKELNEACQKFLASEQSIMQRVNTQLAESKACMKNKTIESHLLRDLREEIISVYPDHKLHIFGSRATGQALPDSDFDFYCDVTGNNYFTTLSHNEQSKHVEVIGSRLKQNRKTFSEVILVTDARVPIVKLIHNPTGMNCDLSFKDGTSVENTRLLSAYLELDHRVRWVLTAVKLWAKDSDIHGSDYFTSHGLSWLVLHFLMWRKLVPPVETLQTSCKTKMINNWNVAFVSPQDWKSFTKASALDFFVDFFRWGSSINHSWYVYCTSTGEAFSKSSLEDIDWMKNDNYFRKYAEKIENKHSKLDLIELNQNGLCVLDPFEHYKNVTNQVKRIQYENFVSLLRMTKLLLFIQLRIYL